MTTTTLGRLASYAGLARDAVRVRFIQSDVAREAIQRHLAQRMGRLRGLPQKLGQMMSFSNAAESDGENLFEPLCDQADPLPWSVVRPIIESAWNRSFDDVAEHVEQHGRAASLGQVHRATLHDGRVVAIKVQYPGIRDALNTDLKMLGWLSKPVGNLKKGFNLTAYRETIKANLDEELDYQLEANRQRELNELMRDDPFTVIPQVVSELSSETVLVSDWEDGDCWNDVLAHWGETAKRKLANGMLQFFLQGLFRHGTMQADWHPGNLRFRQNGSDVQMVMYDLGCTYQPSQDSRLTLGRLIQATQTGDESPLPLMIKLGFNAELLTPLAAKLPALCRVLFEPFCAEHAYDMADWRLNERVSDVLGDDRWNFRIAGSADLVFLMRAFHGLKHYLSHLGTPILWQRPFDSIVAGLSGQWSQLALPHVNTNQVGFDALSRYLKLKVVADGRTKVELTIRASQIDNLEELLDAELKLRIERQGIDLQEIMAGVRRRAYAAGPVFQISEADKQIKVWLE